jgi:PST family polysaccharide transporter
MIRDCLAYMADSFMVWLTAYSGTLVISHKLDSYYLGVYKTGYTTITSYLGIIYGITQPIVFSALSRCQNDEKECNRIYIQYLKYVAYIIIPLGAGMAVFHELVINILLGSDWSDATVIMVCTSLSYPIVMLTGQFNSVYFRAKGKPTIALLVQTIYVIIMILAFIISSNYSFELFSFTAGTVNVFYGVLSIGAMIIFFRFPYIEMFRQWSIVLIATIAMVIVGIILLNCFPNGIGFQVLAAIISAISYLGILLLVPNSRNDIKKVKYIL